MHSSKNIVTVKNKELQFVLYNILINDNITRIRLSYGIKNAQIGLGKDIQRNALLIIIWSNNNSFCKKMKSTSPMDSNRYSLNKLLNGGINSKLINP